MIIAPYDLWPLWEVIKLSIFGKPSSHTTTLASFKFLCSIVSEKSATLKFLGLFCTNYGPLWPLTFARGNQTMHFWKALTTYYHQAKFQDSVINSLWEKSTVKSFGARPRPRRMNPNAMHQYTDSPCFASSSKMKCPNQLQFMQGFLKESLHDMENIKS